MKIKSIACAVTLMLSLCLTLIPVSNVEGKAITRVGEAKTAARKHVPSGTITEVETDMDNGVLCYEVSVIQKTKEYNLKFRASDGKLTEYDWEIPNTSYSIQKRTTLSRSAIRKKALKKVKKATVKSIRLELDDGLAEYKVSLTRGTRSYKLVYNAKNGKLLDYEWKLNASSSSSKYIGQTKAKKIALKKVPGATIIKCEFDNDDGMSVYELELHEGIYEYDITIDAKTGSILEYEKDIND